MVENVTTRKQGKMLRLFVAVQVPDDIKRELVRLQKELDKCHVLLGTYPKPEAMHVTLKFMAEISESKLIAVQEALCTVKMPIIFGQLTLLMVFGSPYLPRVIYVDIDAPQLLDLAKKIDDALVHISEPEQRPFKPHLTLVRVKHVYDSALLLSCLDTLHVNTLKFSIDHFELIQSTLNAKGPLHTTIARFGLNA